MNTDELIEAVKAWGNVKGITGPEGKGTLLGQLEKTQEELTETRDAAAIWQYLRNHNKPVEAANMRPHLEDGFGDCMVTLILAAEMAGMDIRECLAAAYEEIKHRTGRMVNGQFVKN
jgi:NTP pyrophosphatase (non-canonical NTP hydrolase)